MPCGMKAKPAIQSGMKASAAHSAGRHRRDSSLPSGKTSGRTRPVKLVAGPPAHVLAHSTAVPNGSEPGECTTVYRAYAKGAAAIAFARPLTHGSGPTGW